MDESISLDKSPGAASSNNLEQGALRCEVGKDSRKSVALDEEHDEGFDARDIKTSQVS